MIVKESVATIAVLTTSQPTLGVSLEQSAISDNSALTSVSTDSEAAKANKRLQQIQLLKEKFNRKL